jgi:hypothetical protein
MKIAVLTVCYFLNSEFAVICKIPPHIFDMWIHWELKHRSSLKWSCSTRSGETIVCSLLVQDPAGLFLENISLFTTVSFCSYKHYNLKYFLRCILNTYKSQNASYEVQVDASICHEFLVCMNVHFFKINESEFFRPLVWVEYCNYNWFILCHLHRHFFIYFTKKCFYWTFVLYLQCIFLFASSVPLAGYNHGASKFAFMLLY